MLQTLHLPRKEQCHEGAQIESIDLATRLRHAAKTQCGTRRATAIRTGAGVTSKSVGEWQGTATRGRDRGDATRTRQTQREQKCMPR